MRFTVISHACCLIEHEGVSILIDPWIIGSCYWRSWWNFPEPPDDVIEDLKPDFIYLTHLHWDHFHGPSLRRFDRDTPVLVPLATTDRMVRDMHDVGFQNIIEIPHGNSFELAPGFTISSFQFGPTLDSAAVITNGLTTIADLNDCKSFGLMLKEISSRFPKIDFMLRSHSSAGAVPLCVENHEEVIPNSNRSNDDYIEEFARVGFSLGARYAIPFASNHCFLHKETVEFNETATTPDKVARFYNKIAEGTGVETECVVMAPGSSWSAEKGFDLREFNYNAKDEYRATLEKKYESKLTRQYALEDRTKPSVRAFTRYHQEMFKAIPRWIRKRSGLRITYQVHGGGETKLLHVDLPRGESEVVEKTPEDSSFTVRVPAKVFNDCCRQKMFSVWSASKRLRFVVTKENAPQLGPFLTLLDLYEQDFFPLRRNLSRRSLSSRIRRWREVVEFLRLAFLVRVAGRRFDPKELHPPLPSPFTS
ncbi:MBL fold metallo-hydrolase [Planctomycetota bacterium]|nr:MBL fold metallo-hydrolase [Planctomycetota bacterium]